MQIVSNGDNLHEISNPVFWEKNKKNVISLSSVEFTQRVVKVNNLNTVTAKTPFCGMDDQQRLRSAISVRLDN